MSTSSAPELPSNSRFGLLFGAVFAVLTAYLAWRSRGVSASLTAAAAIGFFGLAWLAPAALGPLNRGWFRLSMLLSRFVTPVVLGLLFFLVVTPTALGVRLTGRDPLGLRATSKRSLWVNRIPPGPRPDSFTRQF